MQDLEERVVGLLHRLGGRGQDWWTGPDGPPSCRALRDCGGLDVSDLGMRYLDWWREGAIRYRTYGRAGPEAGRIRSPHSSGLSFESTRKQVA